MQSDYLDSWLSTIAESGKGRIVIVPGGGVFADHVRITQHRLQFDDLAAHKMALRAMEQFGLLIQGLKPGFCMARTEQEIFELLANDQIPVWFPYSMIADNPEIQASWDITSDSLALWLAEQLNFRNLILVKSTVPENNNYSAEFLSQQGYLDKAFALLLAKLAINTIWISHDQIGLFTTLLGGKDTSSKTGYIKP